MAETSYRKLPKISPGATQFQTSCLPPGKTGGLELEAFLRGYFWRGLSMKGNLRFKIDWASLIVGGKFTVFALFYLVFEGNFQVQTPGGLVFGGAI